MNQTSKRPPISLRAHHLTVGHPGAPLPVLVDQAITLAPGRITALVGPNGSGKSTLLKALARQLKPSAGQILLDGRHIATLSARSLARSLGILFQDPGTPAALSVENLVRHGRHPHRGFFDDPTDEDDAAVERALARTGADVLRHQFLNTLSGGQRQLAWLAMALAQEPQVLLLDEPTTFLDLRHQLELMQVISELRDEAAITIAMVLHDVNQAARYADEIVALRDGKVVVSGPPAAVITPEHLRTVFEIEADVITAPDGHPLCVPRAVTRPSSTPAAPGGAGVAPHGGAHEP